ncbi:hypothetical protein [Thermogemmata fonticola]|uniref:Uncharacterized protein n=1 Tax=Thermogemmata fonticola TaxID=2755323 RepID=A0A7V8VAW7_9BACT|nr:hypothetical protein [Thermogemmata fonticola]MBA2224672.1 hypothetical protein [Thermogemmata fonticola]MBA2224674.1 hypothetical protein [Thermogemmata fonticola]
MTSAMQTVLEVAEWCDRRGHPLPVRVLAGILNAAGHRTSYGTPYRGRRGTYRLVKATYRRLMQAGRSAEAAMVARTFTRPNGAYAY